MHCLHRPSSLSPVTAPHWSIGEPRSALRLVSKAIRPITAQAAPYWSAQNGFCLPLGSLGKTTVSQEILEIEPNMSPMCSARELVLCQRLLFHRVLYNINITLKTFFQTPNIPPSISLEGLHVHLLKHKHMALNTSPLWTVTES